MIYIHVPFCRSFCTYCGFYSESVALCRKDHESESVLYNSFSKALSCEILSRSAEIDDSLNTLYIGGGTPSVLPLGVLSQMLSALREAGHPGPYEEFTVEVNPEDIVSRGTSYAESLIGLGVNRISMGVQAFDDQLLRKMNRRHDSAAAESAYRILKEAGFENISIDLIFGVGRFSSAGEDVSMDEESWRRTLSRALSISHDGTLPRHISAYQLSIEEDSAIEKMIVDGRFTEAAEEDCERQYDILCETLADAGYHHYEVSNFALPGYESKHNSAYWRHIPYVGFGPGAHSFSYSLPMGYSSGSNENPSPVRTAVRPDLKAYLLAAQTGNWQDVMEREKLTEEQMNIERIMLSLRTDKGIAQSFLLRNASSSSAVERLISSGFLMHSGPDRLRIPENRFFVSDNIIGQLL